MEILLQVYQIELLDLTVQWIFKSLEIRDIGTDATDDYR